MHILSPETALLELAEGGGGGGEVAAGGEGVKGKCP